MKVFKYPLPTKAEFEIEMDECGKILKVEIQGAQACMWALVNPIAKKISRKFLVLGTGIETNYNMNDLKFISTFQVQGGAFIFHIFEIV
jgi:hypothetical protein